MKMCSCCECKCGPVDIVFIVDSSESIGATNFAISKDFIIAVIDRLIRDQQVKFNVNESRVGVVQYSGENAQEVIRLGDQNLPTLTDLKQAVKNLRWLAEATYTGEALQFSLNNLINRMVKEKSIVLVLTDGRSDTFRDQVPLEILCNKGLKVGGVGVVDYAGRQPQADRVNDVACTTDPSRPGFYFVLNNFAMLLDDGFLKNLTDKLCEEKKCPNYTCPITFSEPTNMLIMLDSSSSVGSKNFEMTKDFTKKLVKRFLSAQKTGNFLVQVAVGQYSTNAKVEANFSSNATKVAAQVTEAKFMDTGTQVLRALNLGISQLRGSGNARKKLLVFADGHSQGITTNQLQKVVDQVNTAGIELYILAIGNKVNEANLLVLVSRGKVARNLFKVTDYNALLRGVYYQTVSRKISLA